MLSPSVVLYGSGIFITSYYSPGASVPFGMVIL